jgi:hypothetical protein
MFCLDSLTHIAQCHMSCNITLHAIPPISLLQILIHLGTARMDRISRVMSLLQNFLTKVIHIGHTYPLLEPHNSLFIFCEVTCLAFFYLLLYLLNLRILKLTLPYLLLESRLYFHSDSFRMSNEPKVDSFKLFIQFPRHPANHCRVHIALATQCIGNHICLPWMIVYL